MTFRGHPDTLSTCTPRSSLVWRPCYGNCDPISRKMKASKAKTNCHYSVRSRSGLRCVSDGYCDPFFRKRRLTFYEFLPRERVVFCAAVLTGWWRQVITTSKGREETQDTGQVKINILATLHKESKDIHSSTVQKKGRLMSLVLHRK